MRISDSYKALNTELHEREPAYGTSGAKWSSVVEDLYGKYDCDSVLDYGAGKGTLAQAIPHIPITNYDPCVPGIDSMPDRADLIVCGDVMEHVEEEMVDNVLDHMRILGPKVVLFVVATRPAKKVLADGRNAHITIKPVNWWLTRILRRWECVVVNNSGGEFIFIGIKP